MDYSAFNDIELHRDFIGKVYFVTRGGVRYVLKEFRPQFTAEALQSIDIMRYLYDSGFRVPQVIEVEQTEFVSVLYEYVEGSDPYDDREAQLIDLGEFCGKLHALMKSYSKPLIEHGRAYFIDRYVKLFTESGAPQAMLDELIQYGGEMWGRISKQPRGFCHGDMHCGNILAKNGRYCLIDFDAAALAHPLIDPATLCDASNYFQFNAKAYEQTKRLIERFYNGYSRHASFSDGEFAAMPDFIALRHYDIQPTIMECAGEKMSADYMSAQHKWLMSWRELCAKG